MSLMRRTDRNPCLNFVPYIDGLMTDMSSVNARNKVPAAILAGTSGYLRKFLTVYFYKSSRTIR